jgi:hypothetical protein
VNKKHEDSVKKVHGSPSKRHYTRPELIEYGHVAKLTAGTSGSYTDKGQGSNAHGNG